MKTIGKGNAHGKVIWIGEHAVVYDHVAIALPVLSAQTEVILKPHSENYMVSDFYEGLMDIHHQRNQALDFLFFKLQTFFGQTPLHVTIKSDLPIGAGLGSSAAVASALTKAFYDLYEQELTWEKRFEWVSYSEKIAHSNPSGIDAFMTMSNQPMIYKKGHQPKPLEVRLNAYLVCGFSGVMGNTKEAVEHIAHQIHLSDTQHAINQIGQTTLDMLSYIKEQNLKKIGDSMHQAHRMLSSLGVSHHTLDDMIKMANDQNALGAKMTGGGLGGCVIALVKTIEDAKTLEKKWTDHTHHQAFIMSLS